MRTITRRQLAWFCILGYGAIFLALAYAIRWGSSEHPIGMAFSIAPIYAFVSFSIAIVVASNTRRDLVLIDLARLLMWAFVGYGIGVANMSVSYYRHFFPQNANMMETIGLATSGLSLGFIVISLFVFPTPRKYSGNRCCNCGYDKRGAASQTCPECGHDWNDLTESMKR